MFLYLNQTPLSDLACHTSVHTSSVIEWSTSRQCHFWRVSTYSLWYRLTFSTVGRNVASAGHVFTDVPTHSCVAAEHRQCYSLKQDWDWATPNLALMNCIAVAQM